MIDEKDTRWDDNQRVRQMSWKTIVKFWNDLPLEEAPYIHPFDQPRIVAISKTKKYSTTSFDQFLTTKQFGGKSTALELGLFPQPYAGDLERAELLILLLNPGLDPTDPWGEFNNKEFRNLLERNLKQDSLSGEEYPFIWLNPNLCWHSGFRYWFRKLHDVINFISQHDPAFEGSFLQAMKDVSRRIASVELFPYHSMQFDHKPLLTLPSCETAKQFARQAAKSGVRTVVTRGVSDWVLTGLPNVIEYEAKHWRGAHMGPNTPVGKEILTRVKQSPLITI